MELKVHDIPQIKSIDKLQGAKSTDNGFKGFFDAAMNVVEETNTLQKDAEKMSVDFALGRVDSISDVMIAQEKASVALQYTVQIRDKVLESYNEIMKMQM